MERELHGNNTNESKSGLRQSALHDFIRTETLCQGGKTCNFRFVRNETDAGEGWERSQSI